MKKLFLTSLILSSLLNANEKLSNDENTKNFVNKINEIRKSINNTPMYLDNFLLEKTKIESKNIKEYFIDGKEKQRTQNEHYKSMNEIIYIDELNENTIYEILSNPYYRNTLLLENNNKIGLSYNKDGMIIYTYNDFITNKLCTKNLKLTEEISTNLCKYNNDNLNDPIEIKWLYDELHNELNYEPSINVYPNDKTKNFQVFSINDGKNKYLNNYNSNLGMPISVYLKNILIVDNEDSFVIEPEFKLINEKKEIENIKILKKDREKNEHFHSNYIFSDTFHIIPLKPLNYNQKYTLVINLIIKKENEDISNVINKLSSKYNIKKENNNIVTEIKFQTPSIKHTHKYIYIDDYNSSNFEFNKNETYSIISYKYKNISCEKNLEKINKYTFYYDLKDNNKCYLYNNDNDKIILNFK